MCENRPVHIFDISIRVEEKNVLSEYLKSHNACEKERSRLSVMDDILHI